MFNEFECHVPCAEFLPEFLHVFILGDLFDHVQSLTDQFLLDHLQEFMLLKRFTTHIQWKIIRVYNATDERQVLGHHVFKVVSDEDTSHIQLDLVHFLAILGEQIVGSCFWDIKD